VGGDGIENGYREEGKEFWEVWEPPRGELDTKDKCYESGEVFGRGSVSMYYRHRGSSICKGPVVRWSMTTLGN
jgi:hypothetical protein